MRHRTKLTRVFIGVPFLSFHGIAQRGVQHWRCRKRQTSVTIELLSLASPAGMSVKFAPMPVPPTLSDRVVSSLVSPVYCITHWPQDPIGRLDHPGTGYVL